jgi:hypothetical protein
MAGPDKSRGVDKRRRSKKKRSRTEGGFLAEEQGRLRC